MIPPVFPELSYRYMLGHSCMETPPNPRAALRDLYPTLADKELEEAESNLRTYFEIAFDVYTSIDNNPRRLTMEERSNTNLKI